ncbi:MAG: HAD-IIIA family hydrolase [Bdellovibrionales bacterium]|nr:HAD-IIIA family hydrolase [Bdellovibrionales bacterium]
MSKFGGKRGVLSRSEVSGLLEKAREARKRIVFTSGVFDLIHPGHVDYLQKAKKLGDILVVAINSDESVRRNKGELRPICIQEARAQVVAALSCVDHVFIFDEANNNENIRLLKPDVYVKAGDYDKSRLSSAPLVESYGGRVEFVPFLSGYSSTAIIDSVLTKYAPQFIEAETLTPPKLRPVVFLDRDGTICEHVDYLSDPSQFQFCPGAVEGMKKFQDLGFSIVIVTNQPGIGFGYFSKEDFYRVTAKMLRDLSEAGVLVDKIYFSTATKAEASSWRKPETGMIDRAKAELNIDLSRSLVIGDSTSDIQFGKNADLKTVLVRTGKGGSDGLFEVSPDYTCDTLLDAALDISAKGQVK